jgi:hypothetical protein
MIDQAVGSLTRSVSPESELLLCCARSHLEPATAARLRKLLDGNLDWEYVLRIARLNEVRPLLYWHLREAHPSAVPAHVLHRLRTDFYANAARSLALATDLLEVMDALVAQRIPVIPLKGPVLASVVYPSLSLREVTDLDILLRARDMPRARSLLANRGYQPGSILSGVLKRAYLQSECSTDFVHEDTGRIVEIHWELMPKYFPFPIMKFALQDHLNYVQVSGRVIPSFTPEVTLLYLCLHGMKHRWERLKWLCDVAELLRVQPDLDWTHVLDLAARLRGERPLLLGISLVNDLLGAPLPDEILLRARTDRTVASLAARVCERLFREHDGPPGEDALFHLQALESPWHRIRYVLHWALIPTKDDWDPLPLPRSVSFLYYPLRPARLIGKALYAVVASLSSRSTAWPRSLKVNV